jgi:hypothetical protein
MAQILSGYDSNPLENIQGAQCDIFQIPDGRGNHIQVPIIFVFRLEL